MCLSSLLLAVVLTAIQLCSIQGCSMPVGYVPWTQATKTVQSNIVVLANVKATFIDPTFDYGEGSRAYNAEVEVMCVFKGETGTIPKGLNVTEAGEIPGKCTTITLEPRQTYILYLFENDPGKGRYIHNDFTPTVADGKAIAAIRSYCGVKSEKVLGASPDIVCPKVSGPKECTPIPVPSGPDIITPPPDRERMDDGQGPIPEDPAQISAATKKSPPNGASMVQMYFGSLILVLVALVCHQ